MFTSTEEFLVPLTPNCLLLGRTSTRVPTLGEPDNKVENYTNRLRYNMELKQFWEREFERQVFFSLLPYQKWKDAKRHTNLMVGDVCLLMYPGKIQDKYRYCRVDEVHPDQEGVVRNVTVSLRSRNSREKLLLYQARKPMKMKVGIQRLSLICPQEEIKIQLDAASGKEVPDENTKEENDNNDVNTEENHDADNFEELLEEVSDIENDSEVLGKVMKQKVVVKVVKEGEAEIKDIK